jgi:hypothetical protein
LQCNTSANMSHNSFVQGLIENNCHVDIIMADRGLQDIDPKMPVWNEANYYIYKSVPKMDRLRLITKSIIDRNIDKRTNTQKFNQQQNVEELESQQNKNFRKVLKYVFYNFLTHDSPHYISRKWLKNASKYKTKLVYDLIISNSSPESSHALAATLLRKKNIIANRWIQLWEDPWYYEFYSKQKKNVLEEEIRLLHLADQIYYVSPLTLLYQKKYVPDASDKMNCLPLPYLITSSKQGLKESNTEVVFGYFGDYYSNVRNLKPFYEASSELNAKVNIYGDTNENFKSTKNINVSGRVEIGVVNKVQENTDVLIHLCNLKGGQIPGKIYHYSGTEKPIIFVLDGEQEEKQFLKDYFGKFNRYHFCDNTKESIKELMLKFINSEISKKSFILKEFSPKNVVANLLDKNKLS